jgi:general secretion pathway protein D
MGTGSYVGSGQQPTEPKAIDATDATIVLNFVNADIQEFVRAVFDEILKSNVIVDPSLTGKITVRTSEPVSRKGAENLVRQVLESNGATLTRSGAIYRVSARSDRPGARGSAGGNVRILPLKFIDATQARSALQPFLNPGTEITANADGRYIVVAGPPGEIETVDQVLSTLDVDHMRGRSLALVPLKEANSVAVAREIGQIFGSDGTRSFRALSIQRMNAILLIGQVPQTVARARQWLERLDRADKDGRRVFVYQVQNRRAAEVATLLSGMFTTRRESERATENPVAPSLTPARTQTAALDGRAGAAGQPAQAIPETIPVQEALPETERPGATGVMQIRADSSTNSVVVVGLPEEYQRVERAIRGLDVLPSQVLIEATIAEVRLNDSLRHGVRWYFQSGNHGFGLTDSATGSVGEVYPGFNYSFSVPNAKAVVNALEQVTDVEIISSPALTVMNNQAATLKVGDQVPIATRSARGVVNADSPVVNDIELKDTGIILSVTPRVNGSGIVMLDISQEASDVVPTTTSSIDSPTIRQRKINSSVAVQSGTEIVLGGLISTNRQSEKQGLPILKDIPLFGAAFTSKSVRDRGRTELMIIIRPTVMGNRIDVQNVTREIKAKMSGVTNALYR